LAPPKKKTGKKTKKAATKKSTARKKAPSGQGELSFAAPKPGRPANADKTTNADKTSSADKTASGGGGDAGGNPSKGPPRGRNEAKKTSRPAYTPVARKIRTEASTICHAILDGKKPSLKFPLRSLQNVSYQPKTGYFKLKGKKKERTLTVGTVKTFAQTLKMMALSKELIETDDIATKREAYYVSKNWGEARFKEQPESDTVMEDVEAFFAVNREQLGFVPEEKGGDVAGRLVVIDRDRDTNEALRIDCIPSPWKISSSRPTLSSSSASRPPACSSAWSSTTTGSKPIAS